MSESGENEALDIQTLEQRVDELVRMVEQLKSENTSLRSVQQHLMVERAELSEKTEQARARIEAMVSRLRMMEND